MEFLLPENKICRGHYNIQEKEFVSFFIIKPENRKQAIDVITDDIFNLNQFYTIDYDITIPEYRYLKKLFNITKDRSIFEVQNLEDATKNVEFFNLLKFFNVKSYKVFSEKTSNTETIDIVVNKIQKYLQRYIGKESAAIYAEQLRKYNSIFEILTLLPLEMISVKIPFWVFELQERNSRYIDFYICSINELKNCNKYNFKIKDLWENKQIIEDKIQEIMINDSLKHKERCISLLRGRLNEANQTLLKEKLEAKKTNDNELVEEIEMIEDEFKEIEKYIESENVNYEDSPYEWWPSLLYPVIEIYKIDSTLDFETLDSMFSYEIAHL